MTDRTMPDALPLRSDDPDELGGYRLLGRLGEGGQGSVFLGRPAGPAGTLQASDYVAVKLLHGGLAGDDAARARFVRELEVAKRVARFCTAQVLDADVAGDRPYIVSEYVPGLSLHDVVRTEGPRTGGALERLAISTLTALTAIHQAGIVHRDFKPHNVVMGPDGPRVIDFGVSRALGAAGETQNVGTPAYMAPENFTGAEVGPAADMFAWGTTMSFAATGRPAFGNDELASIMHRILTAEPDLGDLAGPLREIVLACLAKDPAQRPTARQAQDRLVGAASGTAGGTAAPGMAPVPPPPAFAASAPPSQGMTDPRNMAGAVLPPDVPRPAPGHGTDPSGVRHRTAPQPPPYGPDGPGALHPAREGGGRGRLVPPIAAAAAVAAVIAGGSVWAATRSGDGGPGERPVAASDQGAGARDDAGEAGNAGGGARRPAEKRPGEPKHEQRSGVPATPRTSQRPHRPGETARPSQGTDQGTGRGTGGGSAPVQEPPNKYTPQQACNSGGKGSGYYVLRSMNVSGGVAYLLYSRSTAYNCAVTIKTRNVGKASPVSVWIQKKGGGAIADSGSFAWYAGPVYVHAPGTCVRFGGNGGAAPYGNCG